MALARPRTKEELVEALLSVRRDLELQGKIGRAVLAANDNVSQPTAPSARESAPVPAANDNREPAPAPTSTARQASRPVLLRKVSAEQLSSANDDLQGGLRRDPYREQIVQEEIVQAPAPIPAATPGPQPLEVAPEAAPEVDSALMRQEVSGGLAELLSKWDIFEKSGIFGLGPSGMQHPTYEKIAGLPLEQVLAGSWDGADAGVVKTIGEYVAGWEAEQGVSPREGEPFEMYLRRVIASYLDELPPAGDAGVPPEAAAA